MAENEFEKKVQQMMDEFKIDPSASVWEKVEQKIGEKKRRRLFAWLIPLLLLVLVTAGYFMTYQNSNEQPKDQHTKEDQIEDNTPNNSVALPNTPAVADTFKIRDDKISIAIDKDADKTGLTLVNKKEIHMHEGKSENPSQLVQAQPAPAQAQQESLADLITEDNIRPGSNNKTKNNNENPLIIAENSNNNNDSARIYKQEPFNSVTSPADSIVASSQTQKNSKDKQSKIQWGLDLFYGKVDVVEGIFNGTGDKALAQDLGSTPGGNTASSYYKQPKAGTSFSIGVIVKKDISKRSSVSAGISYSMQRTKIETGNKIDSARPFNNGSAFILANGFYRSISDSSQKNSVTNKYQFLQVPVLWNYRFNNSKKIPLYLNAGIGLSALLTSDALVYDKNYSTFYSDNSLYKKMQFNFLLGMSAQINFKQAALILGPQIHYAPSNLVKDKSYYGSQHLFNYGLHALLLMNKK